MTEHHIPEDMNARISDLKCLCFF